MCIEGYLYEWYHPKRTTTDNEHVLLNLLHIHERVIEMLIISIYAKYYEYEIYIYKPDL